MNEEFSKLKSLHCVLLRDFEGIGSILGFGFVTPAGLLCQRTDAIV